MPFTSKHVPKFSFDIKIDLEFNIAGVEEEIIDIVKDAVKYGFKFLRDNFYLAIIVPLVQGGRGWYGIKDTTCWKWINSRKGLAQLGFADARETDKLIDTYLKAWEVESIDNGMGIGFRFGDINMLRRNLRHPFAGKHNLPSDRTWFDWIYEGQHFTTEQAQFVRTGPGPGVRSSKIAGAYAGIMKRTKRKRVLKKDKETGQLVIKRQGSASRWYVPARYRLDIDYLLNRNKKKIKMEFERILSDILNLYLTKGAV